MEPQVHQAAGKHNSQQSQWSWDKAQDRVNQILIAAKVVAVNDLESISQIVL